MGELGDPATLGEVARPPASLCRYLLRPPLARERLPESAHGQLLFELAHPRADGTTHLRLEPLELIEKIALLIPPPRFHTRFAFWGARPARGVAVGGHSGAPRCCR